jgi:hypothetical protein
LAHNRLGHATLAPAGSWRAADGMSPSRASNAMRVADRWRGFRSCSSADPRKKVQIVEIVGFRAIARKISNLLKLLASARDRGKKVQAIEIAWLLGWTRDDDFSCDLRKQIKLLKFLARRENGASC